MPAEMRLIGYKDYRASKLWHLQKPNRMFDGNELKWRFRLKINLKSILSTHGRNLTMPFPKSRNPSNDSKKSKRHFFYRKNIWDTPIINYRMLPFENWHTIIRRCKWAFAEIKEKNEDTEQTEDIQNTKDELFLSEKNNNKHDQFAWIWACVRGKRRQ